MNIRLLLILILCIPKLLFAQYSDSVHHYASAVSTGTINKTNTSQSYVLNNAIKFGIRKKIYSLNSSNSWAFGEQQRALTNNDFNSTLDFNLYKGAPKHFYYWGLLNYLTSYSLKVNSQFQGGAGIAWNIVDKKKIWINISDGILYEKSDILLNDTVQDLYSTYRNSLRLSFRFNIKEIITFSGMSFYQNSFSSGTDYIIKSNLNLGVKLNKWLALTSSFTYNRFNRTGKENTLFIYGLTLEKYF
ncbi:MAG: hypothetical protein JWQ38_1498 [Flavipsychrobacter sp.]|nr:hypothetical protein [Flavipsychrobacter sp.]